METKVYLSRTGDAVVEPVKELSYVSVGDISTILTKLRGLGRIERITFDFHNTLWVDSAGLGILYNTYISFRKEVSRFRIVNASGQVLRTITYGQLQKQYSIEDDVSLIERAASMRDHAEVRRRA